MEMTATDPDVVAFIAWSPDGSPEYVDSWRKQLKPWLTALRDAHLEMQLPALASVADMETLWLDISAPTERRNNPTVWTLLLEALELLELLARVDHATAWKLLFEAAGSARVLELYGTQFMPSDVTLLPRFVVHIDSDELLEATEITIQSCIRLIVVNEQTSSPRYGRVKEMLLKVWREQHDGQELNRDTHGRVQISLNFRANMEFEDEGETGFVFSQIQNVAFAHSDLSLLERVDRTADGDEDDGDEDESDDGEEDDQQDAENEDNEEDEEDVSGTDDDDDDEEADAERDPAPVRGGEDTVPPVEATLGETVDENGQRQNANPPPRGPFVIESFRYELMEHPVSNMLLYMINEAGKSGMSMSHLTLSTVWHERLHHSVIGGFLLNQLVPWRGRRDILGIRHLTLDLGGFDAAGVRAFCTAIAHSRSLRELEFKMDIGPDENPIQAQGDVWWPWLAYALFSGDADHSINKVRLNVHTLEKSHVVMMRQVLELSDPLAFLFQRAQNSTHAASSASQGPAMAASLNPSALLRLGHHQVTSHGQETGAPGVRVREPGVTYQVVRNCPDDDFIEVLLPGTGVCWTERRELIELQPLTRRDAHPIRELFLEGVSSECASGVVELLSMIGEPIERLTVAGLDGNSIPLGVFAAIQASCKNLKRLHVMFSWNAKIEWLYNFPEAEWMLESLVLSRAVVNDVAPWSQLLAHLSDPTRALTKSLRELHVNVLPTRLPSDPKVDQVLSLCGDMLEKNHRIVRCEVSGCDETEFAKHKERIMAHHDEPICIEKAPLPRNAKLAFLSVTMPPNSTGSEGQQENDRPRKKIKHPDNVSIAQPSRTKLDTHVVRTIMEMAATPERRICGIVSSGQNWTFRVPSV